MLLDVPAAAPVRRPASYDPMTDMWGQPTRCEDCGEPYRRSHAYLVCPAGHNRGIECCGREEHPLYAQFCAYRLRIGHPID